MRGLGAKQSWASSGGWGGGVRAETERVWSRGGTWSQLPLPGKADCGWRVGWVTPGRERGLEGCPGEGAGVGGGGSAACPPGAQSFAEQTLRTLCVACKEVDEDMYEEWRQRHQEASILLQNRAHALHQVYEEMEQNLQVGGAQGEGRPHPSSSPSAPPGSWVPAQSVLTPTSSCWEPQPSRTGSRTVSSTPSSVSSRGTSKCGFSQGTSKVGPRAATPNMGRREARGELTPAQAPPSAHPSCLSSALPSTLSLGREDREQ